MSSISTMRNFSRHFSQSSRFYKPKTGVIQKTWQSAETQLLCDQLNKEYCNFNLSDLDCELTSLLNKHEQYNDKECINLNAATNLSNPKCNRFLSSTIGTRPSLGDIGNKYNRGMKYTDRMEYICCQLLCQLFNSKYSEFRVASGCLSNLYAYMTCCNPYDTILSLSPIHSGHVTHQKDGAAGLYKLNIEYLPLITFDRFKDELNHIYHINNNDNNSNNNNGSDDSCCTTSHDYQTSDYHNSAQCSDNWNYPIGIDLNEFKNQLYYYRPTLVIIGSSMCFYPIDIKSMREIIDQYNNDMNNNESCHQTTNDNTSDYTSDNPNLHLMFNTNTNEVKRIKHCYFMYDAAHMGGIIAGNSFQINPLNDGIDIMTGSTYKSFGGPNGGFLVTNNEYLAEKISKIAYPGLTANYDASKLGALSIAIMDLLEYGNEYSKQCIKNAQILSEELYNYDIPIWTWFDDSYKYNNNNSKGNRNNNHKMLDSLKQNGNILKCNPFTETQFVAMSAEWDWLNKSIKCENDGYYKTSYLQSKWNESKNNKNNNVNKGRLLSMYLENFNILSTEIALYDGRQGIRMGTPELTRLGMKENEMKQIASFFNDIFNADKINNPKKFDQICDDIKEFRKGYQKLCYIRE